MFFGNPIGLIVNPASHRELTKTRRRREISLILTAASCTTRELKVFGSTHTDGFQPFSHSVQEWGIWMLGWGERADREGREMGGVNR